MKRYFLLLIFVSLINISHLLFFKSFYLEEQKKVLIPPGMKLNEIANILHENQIIVNQFAFILWAKINSTEKQLKYGEYYFDGQTSIYYVSKKILEGNTTFRKITIIEGSTKYDLLNSLKEIYPSSDLSYRDIPNIIIADTYFYEITENANEILENVYSLSLEKAYNIWNTRKQDLPIKNITDMFILASIIEKETPIDNEKFLVAGVFFNRLKKNMRLQSDPTVEFSLTLGKKKLGRALSRNDLKFKSDYNTYTNHGLPPSPICFPGVSSLKAVVNPENTEYFYFVADKLNGGHLFSSNYDEHLKNIRKMRMISND